MKTRLALNFGLSALLLGGTVVGCTHGAHLATASSRDQGRLDGQAADLARKADRALAARKGEAAVRYAEAAVAMRPQDADYRLLLGQSYLEAGRFASAGQAFSDTLTLEPANAHAALQLALAQTAQGDWVGARRTLAAHAQEIPASDLGLATALAGDTRTAIQILMPAARSATADAKTRQNLALAFALAGDWRDARVIVAMDLSPAQVDERLGRWAAFVRPQAASDQVAALLGVTPVRDAGQPIALALNATPANVALADATPASAAAAEPQVAPATDTGTQVAQVVFGPRHEVVQAIPDEGEAAPVRGPARIEQASASQRSLSPGAYYVQLGAYDSAAVAHDGWKRATRRLPALSSQTPQGMAFAANGSTVYRLSVGGFAKDDARAMCNHYQARGGRCFIRTGAGDQVAQWVSKGQELASR